MYKQIITITKGEQVLPYSSLKKCCELNADFSYDYIVRFKMPFEYKGWKFNRLSFNLAIAKSAKAKLLKRSNLQETKINETGKCNMHFVNNSCDKTIVWGGALFDTNTLKDANVSITGIYINNTDNTVTIIREIGLDVKRITMSMENARAIGFINLNALCNYC